MNELDKLLSLVRTFPEEQQQWFVKKVKQLIVSMDEQVTMSLEERQELRRLQSEKTWARIRGQVEGLKGKG